VGGEGWKRGRKTAPRSVTRPAGSGGWRAKSTAKALVRSGTIRSVRSAAGRSAGRVSGQWLPRIAQWDFWAAASREKQQHRPSLPHSRHPSNWAAGTREAQRAANSRKAIARCRTIEGILHGDRR